MTAQVKTFHQKGAASPLDVSYLAQLLDLSYFPEG
jgi:hypothetical protein